MFQGHTANGWKNPKPLHQAVCVWTEIGIFCNCSRWNFLFWVAPLIGWKKLFIPIDFKVLKWRKGCDVSLDLQGRFDDWYIKLWYKPGVLSFQSLIMKHYTRGGGSVSRWGEGRNQGNFSLLPIYQWKWGEERIQGNFPLLSIYLAKWGEEEFIPWGGVC